MRCPRLGRSFVLLLLAVLTWVYLSPATPIGVVAAAAEGPMPAARQGYDILLDRFVSPIEPIEVLRAAAEGVLKRAGQELEGLPAAPVLSGDRESAWRGFVDWFDELAGQASPRVERAMLEQMAVAAMAASVKENHTRYMSPKQFADHQAWTRGDVRYAGIGARLRGPTPIVVEIFEGSPAARAGLRAGDVILAVDGVPTQGNPLDASIARIRGPEGSTVQLQVRRAESPEVLEFEVLRQEIKLAFVRSRVLGDEYGHLQLRGFSAANVADEFLSALADLDAAGIRGLIVDLRGNGGGRIDVGVRLASRFVREGPLFEQIDRSGRRRVVHRTGEYWERSIPIVVLVDGGTASMGEIFAQALRESGAARIIGTKTAGSVAAAQVFPLVDGSALQVTVLEIVSPAGVRLNTVGLMPDEVVNLSDDDIRSGIDTQLEAALTFLRTTNKHGGEIRRIGSRVASLPRAA